MKKTFLSACVLFLSVGIGFQSSVLATSEHKNRTCFATHNIGSGDSLTLWSPWLPLSHTFLRYKLGLIANPGNIKMKVPFLVDVAYDTDNAIPGSFMPIEVSLARMDQRNEAEDDRNLVADFGVAVPDKLQVGFGGGISFIGEVGEWYNLPGGTGLWDVIKYTVPKYGDDIARLVTLTHVNIREAFKPPLKGAEKKCTLTKELLNISLADLVTGSATDATTNLGKIVSKIYSVVGSIKPSFISADTAKKIIGKGVEKLFGMVSFIFKGFPEYRWKGRDVTVNLRVEIPNLGIGQDYNVTFDAEGQTRTVKYFIPWNATTNDQVKIKVTGASYDMQLNRKLTLEFALTLFSWEPVVDDRIVFNGSVSDPVLKTTPWVVAAGIPVKPAPTDFGGIDVRPGMTTARVFFYTPRLLMKGKAQVFYSNTLQAEAEENEYKSNHSILVSGLQAGARGYHVRVSGTDDAGQAYVCPETKAFATVSYVEPRADSNNLTGSGPTVDSITRTSARINWTTDQNASTSVLYGASADYAATGEWVYKPSTELEISHSMILSNLLPGTKYYFSAVSWSYNQYGSNQDSWEKANRTFTTLPPPGPPSVYVRVEKTDYNALANVPVIVEENGNFKTTAQTGTLGVTPKFVLDYGKSYVFKAEVPAYHILNNAAPSFTVPAAVNVSDATRSQYQNREIKITMEKDPSPGGFAWDARTKANISGATVSISSPTRSGTTDSGGWFSFEGLNAGTYPVTITKSGYFSETVNATVDSYGLFRGGITYLRPKMPVLNITVYKGTAGTNVFASCPITIKEGTGTLNPTAATNASGKVSWSPSNVFGNDTVHTIKVIASPAANSGFGPDEMEIQLANGETKDVALVCAQTDTAPPVLSNLTFTRTGVTKVRAVFDTDKLTKVTYLKLTMDGQTVGQVTDNNFSLAHDMNVQVTSNYLTQTLSVSDFSQSAKVELKVEDALGNSKTEIQDVPAGTVMPNQSWVSIRKIVNGEWQDITQAQTGDNVHLAAFGQDPDGAVVSQTWEMTGETTQTHAGAAHTQWKLLSVPGDITLKVTFKDDTDQTFDVQRTLTVTEAPPTARIAGLPDMPFAFLGEKLNLPIEADSFSGLSSIIVNWGDGKTETVNLSGEKVKADVLSHAYSKNGKYTVSVTAKSVTNLASTPATRSVDIVNRPDCVLTINEKAPYNLGSAVTLNYEASGAPGFSWELKKGTSVLEQGSENSGTMKKTKSVTLDSPSSIFTLEVSDPSGLTARSSVVAVTGMAGKIVQGLSLPTFTVTPLSVNVGGEVELKLLQKKSKTDSGKALLNKTKTKTQKKATVKTTKSGNKAIAKSTKTAKNAETVAGKTSGPEANKTGGVVAGDQALAEGKESGLAGELEKPSLEGASGEQTGSRVGPVEISELLVDWGDGQQGLVVANNTSPLKHAYQRAGKFSVSALGHGRDPDEWFPLNTAMVTVKDVPRAVVLDSLSPDPAMPGDTVTVKAHCEKFNADKWVLKVLKTGLEGPIFEKEVNRQTNTLSESFPTDGWIGGIYTVRAEAVPVAGDGAIAAVFPLTVREARLEMVLPRTGFAEELVTGVVLVPLFVSTQGNIKLRVDFGSGNPQDLPLQADKGIGEKIRSVAISTSYKIAGSYTVTARLIDSSGKTVGVPESKVVQIAPKPQGADTDVTFRKDAIFLEKDGKALNIIKDGVRSKKISGTKLSTSLKGKTSKSGASTSKTTVKNRFGSH